MTRRVTIEVPYSEGQRYHEVRGYLRRSIDLPAVSAGELTTSSAPVAVYGLNASGTWRHKGEAIVHAYDESFSALPLMYCRASLNDDNRLEVVWVGCSETLLTLPTVRQTAVINRVNNTAAPPTSATGDRYLLDDSVGGVHASWGAGVADDIMQYNGSIWVPCRPGHRYIVNLTSSGADWIYSAVNPIGWTAV